MKAALLLAMALSAAPALAAPFNIVATGDSNTNGYGPGRLQLALNNEGLGSAARAFKVSSGGATSSIYLGQKVDLRAEPGPRSHHFGADAVHGPALTVESGAYVWSDTPNPSAIIIMLGTNDAIQAQSQPSMLTRYQQNMSDIFDYYASVKVGGARPQIFVSTILPIIDPELEMANTMIDTLFNPWLHVKAAQYGFTLVDTNADLRKNPNWKDFYNDGVHLYQPGSYEWMAENFTRAILDANAGDANLDGRVDGADYLAWANHYQQSTGKWSQGDFNHDGRVNGADYVIWANHFAGGTVAARAAGFAVIPEPASLTLALCGSVLVVAIGTKFRRARGGPSTR